MLCTSTHKLITQPWGVTDGSRGCSITVQCGGLVLLEFKIMDPVIIVAGLIIAAVEIYIRLL